VPKKEVLCVAQQTSTSRRMAAWNDLHSLELYMAWAMVLTTAYSLLRMKANMEQDA
jgi:hypothetical protein